MSFGEKKFKQDTKTINSTYGKRLVGLTALNFYSKIYTINVFTTQSFCLGEKIYVSI